MNHHTLLGIFVIIIFTGYDGVCGNKTMTELTPAASVSTEVDSKILNTTPFSWQYDFEDGSKLFKAWANNGKYTVNKAGITDEQAASGKHSYKLDITFDTASYVYWGLPVDVTAEGTLRLSASMRIGKGSTGRAGIGANLQFPPSRHSGCGPYVIEYMQTTKNEWVRRETDLAPKALDTVKSIANKYVAFADGENLGRKIDRIGLFLRGKKGERVVVYVDDIQLKGDVPPPDEYAKEIATRWAPVPIRRQAAFNRFHKLLDATLKDVEGIEFNSPGITLYAQRVAQKIPVLRKRVAAMEKNPDLNASELSSLTYAVNAMANVRNSLQVIKTQNLIFKDVILYAMDNPIVNLRILPDDQIPPVRIATNLQMVAAQGEFRSASMIVQALRNLPGVMVTVSDLTHEKGGCILPSNTVDVRIVKHWYQSGTAWNGISQKSRKERILTPELLVHDDGFLRVDTNKQKNFLKLSFPGAPEYWDTEDPKWVQDKGSVLLPVDKFPIRDAKTLQPTDLTAYTLKQYWFTLRTPESSKPGLYTGKITVSADDTIAGTVPLRVRVLPFNLPAPKTCYDGNKEFCSSIYYRARLNLERYPLGTISSEYKSEEQLRAELRDMMEHGISNPTSYQGFDGLATYLKIRNEVGMRGTPLFSLGVSIGSPQTEEQLAKFAKKVLHFRSVTAPFGIQDVYLYGIDEARGEKLLSQRKAWALLQKLGAKAFVAGYQGHFDMIGDLLNVQIQAHIPLTEEAAKWHSKKHRIFCYANPQTGPENPEVFRRNYGLYLWLQNYDGAMTYAYQHSFGNIYNDFDHSHYREHVFSYPTIDGVIPTLAIEGYREGMDDIRYGTLLKSLIKVHLASPGPQGETARAASAWLEVLDTDRDLDLIRSEMVGFILDLMRKNF